MRWLTAVGPKCISHTFNELNQVWVGIELTLVRVEFHGTIMSKVRVYSWQQVRNGGGVVGGEARVASTAEVIDRLNARARG